MKKGYNLTVEECSRWVSLFECILLFEKECNKRGIDLNKDIKFYNKLKPNIINEYIKNRSPFIEKKILEKRDSFFVFDV